MAGWTADDIAIMASQERCRDLILRYNAQHHPGSAAHSPREAGDSSAALSAASTPRTPVGAGAQTSASASSVLSRQRIPPDEEDGGLGAPALDEPGLCTSRNFSYNLCIR